MKDIANEVGVSRPTVSLVLNSRDTNVRISTNTKEEIFAAAKRLGYRPNELARSIKTGKTNIVGFIGPIGGGFVMETINGISQTLQQRGYLLKLFSVSGNDDFPAIARQCVEQMLCGVICRALSESQLQQLHDELSPLNIPVLLVDNSFSHDWCARVVTDDVEGSRLAVRHLTAIGHKRIGHLTVENSVGFAAMRKRGFSEGMQETGLSVSEKNIAYVASDYDITDDFYVVLEQFQRKFKATAIVCSSDPLAIKAELWAFRRGIKIPDDLSITGYGDLDYSRIACPPLTTVAQPFYRMGARASEKLLEMIEKAEINQTDELIKVELIIRESTGPVAGETRRRTTDDGRRTTDDGRRTTDDGRR
jgi:DNA-binding LacI/PurR family transcriptional regulator